MTNTVERPSLRPDWRRSGLVLLVGTLALMWLVQIVDEVALNDRFEGDGIHPRHLDGLLGIVWSPFLHSGFAHLIANSIPFLVLGGLVVAHGRIRWIQVTVFVIVVGGALTWLLALAVVAGPLLDLCGRAAADLLDPSAYISAVLP